MIVRGPNRRWNITVFQPAKERPGSVPSAAVWNIHTFQMTNESPFWHLIRPLSLRSEHVMFQMRSAGIPPRC